MKCMPKSANYDSFCRFCFGHDCLLFRRRFKWISDVTIPSLWKIPTYYLVISHLCSPVGGRNQNLRKWTRNFYRLLTCAIFPQTWDEWIRKFSLVALVNSYRLRLYLRRSEIFVDRNWFPTGLRANRSEERNADLRKVT